jgi:hypothetical protein
MGPTVSVTRHTTIAGDLDRIAAQVVHLQPVDVTL